MAGPPCQASHQDRDPLCERCQDAPARVCAIDVPDHEALMLFGNEISGLLLCGSCLALTEADGPWDEVHELEAA